jgi:mRNA interferase RelE/StbE
VTYALRLLPRAEKQLSKIDSPYYESIKARISSLQNNPRPSGCLKLRDREGWRIRVGNYRILYEIDDESRTVTVVKVGHRSIVYD